MTDMDSTSAKLHDALSRHSRLIQPECGCEEEDE